MAAWSKEVGRSVLGRTILGEKVVLYRTESGEAVCMSGICPHRMYPLEKGRLVGDSLQCGYHGITFDASGVVPRCLPRTLPAALRRYPVLERAGDRWIWTGEPEGADPRLMPPLDEVGLCDGWRVEKQGPIGLDGRYTLLIDNPARSIARELHPCRHYSGRRARGARSLRADPFQPEPQQSAPAPWGSQQSIPADAVS
jgi:vanillate O-demethylase monooxygenase subunit